MPYFEAALSLTELHSVCGVSAGPVGLSPSLSYVVSQPLTSYNPRPAFAWPLVGCCGALGTASAPEVEQRTAVRPTHTRVQESFLATLAACLLCCGLWIVVPASGALDTSPHTNHSLPQRAREQL